MLTGASVSNRKTSKRWSSALPTTRTRFIANWALNRQMHVYCEKPLGISVEEVRTVRANFVKNRRKVGDASTAPSGTPSRTSNRVKELIRDGAIGELKRASAWGNRQIRRGRLPSARGRAAGAHRLRPVDRPFAVPSLQPGVLSPGAPERIACSGTCSGTSAWAKSATWARTRWTSRGKRLTPSCRPRSKPTWD